MRSDEPPYKYEALENGTVVNVLPASAFIYGLASKCSFYAPRTQFRSDDFARLKVGDAVSFVPQAALVGKSPEAFQISVGMLLVSLVSHTVHPARTL